jgi:putative transposase
MPQYRRAFRPGGTFFLTVVTENRAPILTTPSARFNLHTAIDTCRATRPFTIDAIVLLHDHWHLLLTLPTGDADYSTRIAAIKANFTRHHLATGGHEQRRSASRLKWRRRGVWQRHFWEHEIRDPTDYERHFDYILYNPVKHGLARCPHSWPYSSFTQATSHNLYPVHWQCHCDQRTPMPPNFDALPIHHME